VNINLSLADVIVMVGFSGLVGLGLGMSLWRPSKRERQQFEQAVTDSVRRTIERREREAVRDGW
jgi:hypothetical protein